MIAITDRRNSSTITRVLRRASCWCSKKFKGVGEGDLGRLALFGRLGGHEQLGRAEVEHAGEDAVGERLARGVVVHHRVVERLAREGDLVLGAGELLLQREHVLVGFQVRVRLGEGEHLAEHAGQRALGLAQLLHRRWIAGRGGRSEGGALCGIARLDHRLERLALVLNVALRRLDQVRNQVVAALELHVDLREGVLEAVPERDQPVVDRDRPYGERDDDAEKYPTHWMSSPAAYYSLARRSCARPSAADSTRHTVATPIATSEMPRISSRLRSRVKNHPPAASAPRTATMSITFFALYFSSRATTVKSTSRAGLEMAKFAVRCSAWKAITTASTGDAASSVKPIAKTIGRSASDGPTPKRAISFPVATNCTRMVRMPTARSTVAKSRVRTAGSSEAAATIAACSK